MQSRKTKTHLNKTSYFLSLAAQQAEKGFKKGHGGPFGAVIVLNGKIIANACNTVLKTRNPTLHAEINAIRMASQKTNKLFLDSCVLYSTTEPCPMCFSAIHWARIPQIIYATSIEDVKKLGFNELSISNHQMKKWGKSPVLIQKIKNKSCVDLLKKWSRYPRAKTY